MKTSLVVVGSMLAIRALAAHAAGSVETLPSGVKVEITQEGTGPQPSATDVVKVRYRGTLADGTEFDNSAKHGDVATFPLNRVIPCWTQGMQKLRVGGKAKLTCPPETAYGSRGVGPIPPNSTLNFEVELVDIVK
ncbi:FKBP-type peptidyl-prolyl cis-trans isomerase [Trinickia violacea]|uniref:Peptidyl-prolyl cis-trans isomerase n=1 Tax=Trinickia violacea TaxID=2571746 RepID=A0A4V1EGX3_9BURK|nr:FKBP-type peptidyl-prolyl cis-trans isomerase [Trinickia violacea]QCP48270.1 FKBP-type peptidyl-prolyl cis-trans isomerase [Trinickia violacea]